ncbi:hypothetical protein ABZ845_27235 [Streptomyces sp. NPDC047022]|uniref:hypothetical protein n=1 Tax=Streptomyces sp. NPDC047022 TaxID=3155737 RepID=UPI0033D4DE4F
MNVHTLRRTIWTTAAASAMAVSLSGAPADAAARTTWYVSATAEAGGSGSYRAPFHTLADVERASRPGDTIIVLPSPASSPPLDGGIALKPGQKLIGYGPKVTAQALAAAPRITNSSGSGHSGDAVELADGAEVSNLVITGAHRGGVYGSDVTGVQVHGNDISGTNTSCTAGFFIKPFTYPTTTAGVGKSKPEGHTNGWAGVMVDEEHARGSVSISDNVVHDGACGDGIDLRISGTAHTHATVTNNLVTRMRNGGDEDSLLAIGMATTDTARLAADLTGNTERSNGASESDSEGIFAYPGGASTLMADIHRNTFEHGVGGTSPSGRSANGIEFVTLDGNPHASVTVADSTFYDDPGDMVQELNWGVNSAMRLTLDHVTVSHTTGAGDIGTLPFNNGDCLLESNGGSGTTTSLLIAHSRLTGCANNGLTVHSNVVNGNAPASDLAFTVDDSVIRGNRAHNLRVNNLTRLTRLTGVVQNSDLSHSQGDNTAFDQNHAATTSSTIDLGGGTLGSRGHNCLDSAGRYAAETTSYDIMAEHDWWGRPSGPIPGQTAMIDGTITTGFPLDRPTHPCTG